MSEEETKKVEEILESKEDIVEKEPAEAGEGMSVSALVDIIEEHMDTKPGVRSVALATATSEARSGERSEPC